MKYYAVVIGKNPGIYTDWPTVQNLVKGVSGAIYKSFPTRSEAQLFFDRSKENLDKTCPTGTIAYTDGSYMNGKAGYGIVIQNEEKIKAYGRVPLTPVSNNVGELFAFYVTLSLIPGDLTIYSDSNYAIAAVTSYIHSGQSMANQELVKTIHDMTKNRTVAFKHVMAHCGIELNEEADRLADLGRESENYLNVYRNGELCYVQN